MSESLTSSLRATALEAGADIVGVAPVERFADLPVERRPETIFPECRNVVVLGKRIARGCLRGVEEGTQMALYRTYAMNWLPDRFLALTTVKVASWLEDQRWEAAPLPCLDPNIPPMGVPVREGAPAPNVMLDFADAAVRAGLGEIGLSGELMTPEFGHLQRLQVILTDAPLEATAVFDGQVCDLCGACAKACPLDAIDTDATSEIEIAGKTMTVAKVDYDICRRCRNGAVGNPHHAAGRPDIFSAACMRACVQHMHEAKALSKPFQRPFRNRPAWVIDEGGLPKLEGDRA